MSLRSSKVFRGAVAVFVIGAALSYAPVAKYAWPLAILAVIIAIHELGHLLGALAVGIKVHRYAVFFGPSLFEWSWRGIQMRVGTIPLGGFVEPQAQAINDGSVRGCSVEEKRWWQQLIFFGGGIAFNIVTGFLACVAITVALGTPSLTVPPVVQYVLPDSAGTKAGLLEGDLVTHVDEASIETSEQFYDLARTLSAGQHTLRIVRNGEEIALTASLLAGERLGIRLTPGDLEPVSLQDAVIDSYLMFTKGLHRMALLLTGNIPVSKSVSGPIAIVSTGSELTGGGFLGFANLFVALSYAVALSNLIPIPGLDGSHIVFALLKAIRLEPPLYVRRGLVALGLVLLLVLSVLIAIKDVMALMA